MNNSLAPDTTCLAPDTTCLAPDFDTLADIVAENYPDDRPPPVDFEAPNINDVMAWKLLHAIEKEPKSLKAKHALILSRTAWFADFFTACMFKVDRPPLLTYSDMIHMLIENCAEDVPMEGVMKFCKNKAGKVVVFVPEKALAALKTNWNNRDGPSASEKKKFLSLPWAETWIKAAVGDTRQMARVASRKVSKENKVVLLRIFHPTRIPTYKDEYPIRVDDNLIYTFRPSEWLPDIANNWLSGSRPHVNLSIKDKSAIERLPWFDSWIDRLRILRERKRCREDTQIEPYFAVAQEDTCDSNMGDIMGSSDEEEQDLYGTSESQPIE